ncbi:hypothetical protein [Sutcliffiella deserti]|uniref:hypothetical protein n=1 Tax=Sutcliffiella deserti TaxID=2875501 RepID=UPI001CBDBBDE|nr:hypothetical protein [Sutcliffiella deserti]
MGYVLPVQMDTYTQYANRTASTKEYIKLDPVVKPTFYRVDSQYSWEDIQKNNHSRLVERKREEQTKQISDRLLFDITGKGRYINESI